MDSISTLVEIGLKIHERARTARTNRRLCEMLGVTVYGLTLIANDVIEMYTDMDVPDSAFAFLDQLQRELRSAEELVEKAGSMSQFEELLCANKYRNAFEISMDNINILLSAINTVNSTLAVKYAVAGSRARSIERDLTSLKEKSMERVDMIPPEHQEIWIQLSKTMDKLMNEVITREHARQQFMHHMENLYNASESQGNLRTLFRFLDSAVKQGRVDKDERAQLFNKLLLEVAIRLTLNPPDRFFCPMAGEIMTDPVTIKEANVQAPMERSFVEEWCFERGNKRCPITNQLLGSITLVPDTATKSDIEAWKLESGWLELVEDGCREQQAAEEGPADQGSSMADQDSSTMHQSSFMADQGNSTAHQGSSTADQGNFTAHQGSSMANQGSSMADQGSSMANQGSSSADQGSSSADQGSSSADHGSSTADQGSSTADQCSFAANERPDFLQDLINAARKGDTGAVKEFLDWGTDIDGCDNSGRTALIRACNSGKFQTAQLLIEEGANLERKSGASTTPLCAAASGGHLTLVQELLQAGAYIEGRDDNGFTPLIEAAYWGREEIVKELVNRGADVEAQDSHGNTALMKACEKGHVQIVKILIKEVPSLQLASECQKSVSMVGWRKEIATLKAKPAYDEIEKILKKCIKKPSSRTSL